VLEDRVVYYYGQCDTNCAETILHAANDEWHLGLSDENYKVIAGFGAGCGCEKFCGAAAGCLAALGVSRVHIRAHKTENFPDQCADLTQKLEKALGSLECGQLKALYRTEESRCLKTLQIAARVLQEEMEH
jgi:C_GCAxxG_C_C family probable redox protein